MSPMIRPASPADAASIARLLRMLGHDPATLEHLPTRVAEMAEAPEALVLVASLEATVVGVASGVACRTLEYPAPRFRVSALIVDPAFHRRGIGTALIRATEEAAARLGCFSLELTSAADLTAGHAFWRALGYHEGSLRFTRSLPH